MQYVEDYFQISEFKYPHRLNSSRTVYLATDEPQVFAEAIEKYPQYKFINAKSSTINSSFSKKALSIILDMHFLYHSDYLVCTLTSNVCRLASELMQVRYADASWRVVSLDDSIYTNSMQDKNRAVAILDHIPEPDQNEIELKKGDILTYLRYANGNSHGYLNGYYYVCNIRLNKNGLAPSYKIKRYDS
jgi:glycoprotein 6-alpha-L-fucosyltransferase